MFPRFRKRPLAPGITPILVRKVSNGIAGHSHAARHFIPIMCMHCEHDTPCVKVCPQQAVEVDKATGIVMQMPQRCLGCRYCMTACPYHARYFNWWDPAWPAGMEKSLNPGVAVADARRGGEVQFLPCAAAFGERKSRRCRKAGNRSRRLCSGLCGSLPDWSDPFRQTWPTRTIPLRKSARSPNAFRLLARLGTEPKIYYKSKRAVGESAGGIEVRFTKQVSEVQHG